MSQPNYAGYVAWRAMLDESEVPPDIHAEIFERYTFCLPDGELFLAYPVPGRNNETQPGRRAYNIVWYRPTDPEQALVDLCTDASGRCHGTSIPPPLIRPEVTAAIKATARALVAPQVAEIFARTAQPFFQPIFDLESPRTVFGRVALLGDAAFVARPHVGAGVTKAALDAASLADAVSGGRPRRRPVALPARAAAVRQRAGRARARRGRLSERPAQAARSAQRGRASPRHPGRARCAQFAQRESAQRAGAARGALTPRGESMAKLPYPTGVTLTETSRRWPPEAKMTPSIGATSA